VKTIEVLGLRTRYLSAGAGGSPPLVLLHGVGTSAGEWTWVLPALARNNLVYAIDLPGYDGSAEPPDYTPAFTARFVSAFLDAVGVESAVVVASSFGGLVALRLALSEPERVSALVLADSAGLDRAVNPALAALAFPKGSEELMAAWTRTPLGAAHRVSVRAFLLFARPWQIPVSWLTGQYKVAQLPNFTRTELAALRATINLAGQREMLLDRLPHLQMPTLIVWGMEDRLFPFWQAKNAVARLPNGFLKLIPNCGHLPHIEHPKRFVSILGEFLGSV
jgi:4,5:9,10-diseco-3-hydroxy-5,9,17-trioxoandrosta-1(10),2-diene-4-oate hydrolase